MILIISTSSIITKAMVFQDKQDAKLYFKGPFRKRNNKYDKPQLHFENIAIAVDAVESWAKQRIDDQLGSLEAAVGGIQNITPNSGDNKQKVIMAEYEKLYEEVHKKNVFTTIFQNYWKKRWDERERYNSRYETLTLGIFIRDVKRAYDTREICSDYENIFDRDAYGHRLALQEMQTWYTPLDIVYNKIQLRLEKLPSRKNTVKESEVLSNPTQVPGQHRNFNLLLCASNLMGNEENDPEVESPKQAKEVAEDAGPLNTITTNGKKVKQRRRKTKLNKEEGRKTQQDKELDAILEECAKNDEEEEAKNPENATEKKKREQEKKKRKTKKKKRKESKKRRPKFNKKRSGRYC
jgi:hypothetical protein